MHGNHAIENVWKKVLTNKICEKIKQIMRNLILITLSSGVFFKFGVL